MNKKYLLIAGFLLLVLGLVVFIGAKPPRGECPIQSDTNIVFYGETGWGGVGTMSKSWIIHFLEWWKQQDPSIKYVELDSGDVKADCNLVNYPDLKLYIQPGGDAYKQQNKLASSGKNNILNYVNNGGGFFGTCAGFYYTALDYYWQGSYYNWPDMLDYYPATVEGSITDIADYDSNTPYALTPLSTGFNAIYYGGPTIGWRNTQGPAPGITEATYTAISGNLPAIIKYNKALLTSVHLEAFENDGIQGLSTEDRIENYKYLANLINEVAGTNFYVPSYTNPQCSDGIDNDQDFLVDYPADLGCTSLNDGSERNLNVECDDGIDNDRDGYTDISDIGCIDVVDLDETNCGDNVCEGGENWQTCSLDCQVPQCSDGLDNDGDNLTDYPEDSGCTSSEDNSEINEPVTIFYDDFESGSLNGWTLTKVSGANHWAISLVNPYQGTYHAQSQPRSTNEPASVIERGISTFNYNNIKFSYYRRLIGLDTADEFKAKWFDGNSWFVLEQTGSNSANDASYKFKEFILPSSANNNPNLKIKFECTAGATSEYCRVDNVKILGE